MWTAARGGYIGGPEACGSSHASALETSGSSRRRVQKSSKSGPTAGKSTNQDEGVVGTYRQEDLIALQYAAPPLSAPLPEIAQGLLKERSSLRRAFHRFKDRQHDQIDRRGVGELVLSIYSSSSSSQNSKLTNLCENLFAHADFAERLALHQLFSSLETLAAGEVASTGASSQSQFISRLHGLRSAAQARSRVRSLSLDTVSAARVSALSLRASLSARVWSARSPCLADEPPPTPCA